MPWSSRAAQPPQADGAPPVAQHAGAHVGVGGVDRDVERRQALVDHPLEVDLREPGQRRKVAVEERQPVVVVLQVQAPAHALRQLVDETELAMVVTGAYTVEDRGRDLEPERLTSLFDDRDLELDPAAHDLEIDHGLVREQLVLDDVSGHLPVHRAELVAGPDPGTLRRRMLGHGHYLRSRHFQRLPWSPVNPARDQPSGTRGEAASSGSSSPSHEASAPAWRWPSRRWRGWCECSSRPSTATTRSSTTVSSSRSSAARASCSSTTSTRCPPLAPLMLSAHGSAPEVEEAAACERARASWTPCCPLVTKVHHELKVRARKGYTILYVGHAGHEEAVGTMAVAPERGPAPRGASATSTGSSSIAGRRWRCSPRRRSPTRSGRASSSEPASATRTSGCRGARTSAMPRRTASRR